MSNSDAAPEPQDVSVGVADGSVELSLGDEHYLFREPSKAIDVAETLRAKAVIAMRQQGDLE